MAIRLRSVLRQSFCLSSLACWNSKPGTSHARPVSTNYSEQPQTAEEYSSIGHGPPHPAFGHPRPMGEAWEL